MKKIYLLMVMVMVCVITIAQTPVPMSIQPGMTYTENFADISNWTNNFALGIGANRWGSVAVNSTGTIPDGVKTTVSTATFQSSGSSGGVQRGSLTGNPAGTIVLLSVGTSNSTSSCAIDIYLDYTGVNAGTISFNWTRVNNNTGDRVGSLKVYTSIDGVSFTELSGASVNNIINNGGTSSGTITSVSLPATFNNSSSARIRFYYFNGTSGGSSGSRPKIAIDDLSITAAVAVTPDIAISSGSIGASSENQGATDVVLQRYDMTVTSANATLNGLTVNTAGTYSASDLVNLKVRYSADNVLDVGDATLSTKTTGLGAGSQVFPSFTTQTINNGTTGYVFVTADISGSATPGNTINIGTTAFSDISFLGTVNKTGTDPVSAAGLKTFAALVPSIAITAASPAAGSINQNSANNLLYGVQLDVTVNNATLNSASFTTAGTYQVADLQANSFKLWINSSNSLSGATQLGTAQAIVASGNTISFSGLSEVINNGDTRYLLVTTDVAYNGAAGNIVSIAATPFSNLVFVSGTKTGTDPVAAGNDQTIAAVTPLVTITQTGPSASNVANGANNVFLYQWNAAVTTNVAVLNSFTVNTAGTYVVSDLAANSFKLWYNSSSSFGTATQIGTSQAIVASGSPVTFSGLTQQINPGATGYFWVTVDVDVAATSGNTINIASTPFTNISFATATLSGTDPMAAGGVITIEVAPVAGEIVINQFNPAYSGAGDEYLELVNKTNKSFDLSLLRIFYQSSSGSGGSTLGTLSGIIPPYGYWLLSTNPTVTVGLTNSLTADNEIGGGFAGSSGQFALQVISTGAVIDALGYGNLTGGTLSEGTAAVTPSSPANSGLKRNESDDTNDNSVDFTLVPVANIDLRNSSSRLAQAGSTIDAGTYTRLVVKGNSTAGGNITATDRVELLNGTFTLGNNNLTTDEVVGGSSTAYVVTDGSGTLTINNVGATNVLFPVGPSGALYHPATINNAGTVDNFSVKVSSASPACVIAGYSVNATWDIAEAVTGGSNCTLSLDYTGATTGGSYNASTAQVIHCSGGGVDNNSGSVTGTVATGSGFGSFSPFGISNDPVYLPVALTGIKAYQLGSANKIEWSNLTESGVLNYHVERSANGSGFSDISVQTALKNDGSRADYIVVDANPLPGVNFYRIRTVEANGKILYTNIVKVNRNASNMDMVIYPNPVTGGQFSLQLPGLAKNVYTLRIVNTQGQQVYNRSLTHNGNATTEVIQLPARLSPGIYNLQLLGDGLKLTKSFVVQ